MPETIPAHRPPRTAQSGWSIPLVRVMGIQIRIHLTFFLLVALVAWSESRPGGLGLGGALVWLAAIFGSVLVHEMAHSIVARTKGAEVQAIVLLPIGGVSQLRHTPKDWRSEFVISVVGPLTSLGLAVLAGAAAAALGQHLLPVNIYDGPFLPRLAWVNLLLGGFNLLPAFPLDGGRVLRSLLERRRGAYEATRQAAALGKVLGGAMVVLGFFWNIWLILIGGFVFIGAVEEQRLADLHARLRGLTVAMMMRPADVILDADQPIGSVRWVADPQQLQFPVTSGGRYVGLADRMEMARGDPAAPVGTVTDAAAPYLRPDEDVGASGLDEMLESGYRSLAVVDQGRVVGMARLDDLSWYLTRGGTPR